MDNKIKVNIECSFDLNQMKFYNNTTEISIDIPINSGINNGVWLSGFTGLAFNKNNISVRFIDMEEVITFRISDMDNDIHEVYSNITLIQFGEILKDMNLI